MVPRSCLPLRLSLYSRPCYSCMEENIWTFCFDAPCFEAPHLIFGYVSKKVLWSYDECGVRPERRGQMETLVPAWQELLLSFAESQCVAQRVNRVAFAVCVKGLLRSQKGPTTWTANWYSCPSMSSWIWSIIWSFSGICACCECRTYPG